MAAPLWARVEHVKVAIKKTKLVTTAIAMISCPALVLSDVSLGSNLNFHGVAGLIDTPSALSMPDGELSTTISHFGGITRNTLTFQISDRLSGSFRYSATNDWPNDGFNTYYDRSFDVRYRVFDEGRYMPAITVGLQDFIGTGLNSAEYIVATKHLGQRFRVTGGLGWGRLGSYNSFANPFGFDDRPSTFTPTGGTFNLDRWFHGPAAFFGGVEYQATDRLRFMAEYSSDAYDEEVSRGIIDRKSPFNFGLNYQVSGGVNLGAYYLYGSEVGLRVSFGVNPNNPGIGAGSEPAPLPINPRQRAAALTWPAQSGPSAEVQAGIVTATAPLFEQQGLELHAIRIEGNVATVRFANKTYNIATQALGRAARVLSYAMPTGVTQFRLVPVEDGVPMSVVSMNRADLEVAEHATDGGEAFHSQIALQDAVGVAGDAGARNEVVSPRFTWGVSPYVQSVLFGLDNPIRADFGVKLSARYDFAPGLSVSAAVRKRVIGDLDTNQQLYTSGLPRVRTERPLYDQHGDPSIQRLSLDYIFRPGRNLYGRVSLGYLESMFGGVSTELLWKPVDRPFAIGAEVNYAVKRDYDQLFGFQDYDVVTGHVSGYYRFGNGYHAQVDVGRYLAGDWGATLSLNREFANGWRIGAFMTKTNVTYEEFGDGSFDKGIQLTIPLSPFIGQPSRSTTDVVLRPFRRDGGARLELENRLYETVRSYHDPNVADTWGRFLR